MEHGPFIDDFPIKTSIYKGFSMAMLNNQMVDDFTIRGFPSGRPCLMRIDGSEDKAKTSMLNKTPNSTWPSTEQE